jgi:hypothetical protein
VSVEGESPSRAQSTGSFEFFDDYAAKVYALQPELYREIRRVIDARLRAFEHTFDRKPVVLDVGGAGLIPFDASLVASMEILDLFPKQPHVTLPAHSKWIVGDVLSATSMKALGRRYDFVLMFSLLHHLCGAENGIRRNLAACFENAASVLQPNGAALIIESTCSAAIATLEDVLYPIYAAVLKRVFHFAYVRMVSKAEIAAALRQAGFVERQEEFRQPKHIAQMFWRVPLWMYPLRISFFSATRPLGQ